jgi:hypothetical protein
VAILLLAQSGLDGIFFSGFKMTTKSLKVDRGKFEKLVKTLIHSKPLKREDVKVSKKKPEKLIPPQK